MEKALKTRVEERLQFTRSDEAREERTGVSAARAAKRLERQRESATIVYFQFSRRTRTMNHSLYYKLKNV